MRPRPAPAILPPPTRTSSRRPWRSGTASAGGRRPRMPGRRCSTRWTRSCGRCAARSDGLTESMQLRASIRIPLGLTPETVQARIEGLAPTGARLRFWGADPPYRAEKNTPLVRAFLAAIRAEGLEPAFKVKSGTSDMNVVGPAWNCPIVAYGPGDSSLDHTPNEHLDLAEYRQAIRHSGSRSPLDLSGVRRDRSDGCGANDVGSVVERKTGAPNIRGSLSLVLGRPTTSRVARGAARTPPHSTLPRAAPPAAPPCR